MRVSCSDVRAKSGTGDIGVYFADITRAASRKTAVIRFLDFRLRQLHELGAVSRAATDAAMNLSAARDGSSLIWIQLDKVESNLMSIENLR